MHRNAMKQLIRWKNSKSRKPMVIKGARQVGKTWLMKEFGRTQYESCAYINLDGNKIMTKLFELDYDIDRIIEGLELASGVHIIPDKTLIVLDEIQEVPKALSALKYFYENRPDLHVVVAGSLLGVALHEGTSFPVGKVNFMDLYPLGFVEFLRAIKEDAYADLLAADSKDYTTIDTFSPKLIDLLKTYYVVGGMPEVIERYIRDDNLLSVRDIQHEILSAYEQDFSKHAPVNIVPKLRDLWDSVPVQLSKENKRFVLSQVREGARTNTFEAALLWLEDAGITSRVTKVRKPALPLASYESRNLFKLFFLDVGLLGAKSGLNPQVVLEGNRAFEEFKGALTEQYVFQELRTSGVTPYYFANSDSKGEIDFVVQLFDKVVPVEVKAGKNVRSQSLDAFVKKYDTERAVKVSMNKYVDSGVTCHIPLYMAHSIKDMQ